MTSWQFILITILLMKLNNYRAINGTVQNLGLYNESIDIEKRLPPDVIPSKYVIVISPNFKKDEFHGSVRINIDLQKIRNHIVLHSNDLTISSTKLYSKKTKAEVRLRSTYPIKKWEMFVIKFHRNVPPGEYFLKMNFTGSLTGKITGFYLSTYVDVNRSIRKLAVTQFEATHARKAFPCFDEPSFKSVFAISVIYQKKSLYHALSNMPITKEEAMEGDRNTKITTFDLTPPMSTYLVAFIVSDFKCVGSNFSLMNGTKIPLSVCMRPMYKDKTKFALNLAIRVMRYYLRVLQIDYTIPKLDLVAIPDFAAGAMENWGLITFRETELIHNDNSSSCLNTKGVSLTIAHELAHMWFGNLVTMKWWNDIWLNEGFATYMQYKAIDSLFPAWNLAAAVIRMLEDAIGNFKFMHAIRSYLQKYQFNNVESRELFKLLGNSSHVAIDMVDFMNRWTKFPGFPVINVRPEKGAFQLSRRRFAISKKFQQTIDDGSWTIPIKYVTSRRDGVKLDWFLANFSCVQLSVERPVDWIKLNHDSVGYYIVNYTKDAWYDFSNLLSRNYQALSAMNRADLLHDALLLAKATELHYYVVMNLTSYLTNETAYQPWVIAAEWFDRTNRLLDGTYAIHRFQSYARNLIEKVYDEVGWHTRAGDTLAEREFRVLILNAACTVGHVHCLKTAGRKLKNFLRNKNARLLPADIRSIVYSFGLVALSHEVGSIFENMSHLLAKETDAQERERLMFGMTGFRNKDILNRYLERAMDERFIRKQDFPDVIIKIATNSAGLDTAWTFVRSRLNGLIAKYQTNEHILGRIIGTVVSLFKDRQRLQEVRQFFLNQSELKIGESTRKNAIEEIENNINWLDANMQSIEEWLTAKNFN